MPIVSITWKYHVPGLFAVTVTVCSFEPEVVNFSHPKFSVDFLSVNIYLDNPDLSLKQIGEILLTEHNISVVVMEPVRGGMLANVCDEAKELFTNARPDKSIASWALRYVASFPNVKVILSGMSNMEQMEDNLSYMQEFVPLNDKEMDACFKAADIIKKSNLIPCTGCKYCVDGCPKKIMIPSIFAIKNAKILNENYDPNAYSQLVLNTGKASECIKCGKCEKECPQHLPIREYLEKLSKEFDR